MVAVLSAYHRVVQHPVNLHKGTGTVGSGGIGHEVARHAANGRRCGSPPQTVVSSRRWTNPSWHPGLINQLVLQAVSITPKETNVINIVVDAIKSQPQISHNRG